MNDGATDGGKRRDGRRRRWFVTGDFLAALGMTALELMV
jgi:hypothetical protein